jgi:general secretion pathway protein G
MRNNAFTNSGYMKGFTLLEMLVVLVIIGLLVSMVGPRLFSKVDSAKVQTAAAQIKLLRGAIETMRMDINVYPTEEQGLRLLTDQPADPALRQRWKGPYLEGAVPPDPWGNPYQYRPPESSGQPFTLISFGGDGKPGGSGTDQDVGVDTLAPQPSQN